ncbi:helix-turn-helix domain-containing protein [Cetobacterium sp. 2A]|uniref:helix-turn-helix domain-containing protein n=1 Tax=Cetobacterium sp. 2A TaxID=2754723 RepID=UPI00163CBFC6|nr:helix-turn-helix domain-containing protein [Cetobacterium sp. 2A]MBC2855544.1 helix-turn-helix domain-containing protein [Cetobacterium sp. 2A]
MYINSRHLRIVKMIVKYKITDLEIIAEIFNISVSAVTTYIKDIGSLIAEDENIKPLKKLDKIIELIKKKKGLVYLLKSNQEFRKKEKIDYLIFILLTKKEIHLNDIADNLGITRRILNYHLTDIKEILKAKNLSLESTTKGIKLIGEDSNIKRMLFGYFYKFLIERHELPKSLRKIYIDYIELTSINKILKDIYKLNKITKTPHSHYSYISYFSFLAIHIRKDPSPKMESIKTFSDFLKIAPSDIDCETLKKIYHFFKETIFNQIPVNHLYDFFFIFQKSHTEYYKYDEDMSNLILSYKSQVQNFTSFKISSDIEYIHLATQWFTFAFFKELYNITDLTFFEMSNMTLDTNIVKFFINMKTILPKFGLYESALFYLGLSKLSKTIPDNNENIFIYKSIPDYIITEVKNYIEKSYSLKFKEIINIYDLPDYLKENKVDCVVAVESFKFNKENIKMLKFPFPSLN